MLLANGHHDAGDYPLGMVGDEMTLTLERIHGVMATEGVIMQAAAASVINGKKGGEHFNKLLKQLTGD